MSQPEPKSNEPSKMKKLLDGGGPVESPLDRIRRSAGGNTPQQKEATSQAEASVQTHAASTTESKSKPRSTFKFLPAFWTIASVISFTVNFVLLIVLALVLQNLKSVGVTVMGLSDHLLGGLYNNFVKMDQAHIITEIPVRQEIPVNFTLNVSGPTNVTLSQDVAINGALVTVNTGGLNINNARANIVLPEGTVLPIIIQNLVVPVDTQVLAELNVKVDIPLNQTDLHTPFVGLRQVVEPFYCLLNDCP